METRTLPRVVIPGALWLLAFAIVGCTYDAPLSGPQSRPVDSQLFGVWRAIDEDADEPPTTMIVLPFSSTEYLIHYPTATDDSNYFRGYPIEVAGVTCVQLELLGTHNGRDTTKTPFTVALYSLRGDTLEVRTLNESLVSADLSGTEALAEAFAKHASDPELFHNPGRFKRVTE